MISCNPSSSSFSSVLLDNSDALKHCLSYLNIHDLANSGFACKTLAEMVFDGRPPNDDNDDENDDDDDNSALAEINVCWEGAEKGLTGQNYRLASIPSKKEHCHLFAKAAAYAKICDESETMPVENEMGIDVALKLMNIQGIDQEFLSNLSCSRPNDDEEAEHELVVVTEEEQALEEQREREMFDKLRKEKIPEKEFDHEIFVRITRDGTNEIVGQAFVPNRQITEWYAPLSHQELKLDLSDPFIGLLNTSEFSSLVDSVEFDDNDGTWSYTKAREYTDAFRYTIVAISKSDLTVRLIRCTTPFNGERRLRVPYLDGRSSPWYETQYPLNESESVVFGFPSTSKWDMQSFRLCPCPFDKYIVTCEVGVVTRFPKKEEDGGTFGGYPCIFVSFLKDPRPFLPFFTRLVFDGTEDVDPDWVEAVMSYRR